MAAPQTELTSCQIGGIGYPRTVCADPRHILIDVVHTRVLQDLASEAAGEGDENALGDVVEEELAATSQAVEEAARKIQAMLAKSREDDSGVKLEVNERILDSCTGLMKTIKTLIIRARDLQGEIIAEGMVRDKQGLIILILLQQSLCSIHFSFFIALGLNLPL